jgi:Ras-related GTP-binding protein A/B
LDCQAAGSSTLSEARVALWPQVCQADELVLFERATFLVISNVVRRPHADVHRFEKVSNIIKQFKLSCSKSAAHFSTMQVRNSHYSALIEGFTSTTYAMVITSDPTTQPATILINIEASRAYFESLIATVSLPKFDFQRST